MQSSNRRHPRRHRRGAHPLTFFKVLVLFLCLLAIAFVTVIGSVVLSVLKSAPEVDPKNYRASLSETSAVFDDQDQLVEKLVQNEFMEYVPLDRIPQHLQDAVVAIEDERFYQHGGVDFKRVGGALLHDIKTRSLAQGASTLTMQLAKNLYTNQSKDVFRKIQDVYYAFQLENSLSKSQILEAYLNSASFSKGTVGVQAAAKTFFDKDVSELTLAESALIAGITNRPTKYTPYNVMPFEEGDDIATHHVALIPLRQPREVTEEDRARAEELLDLQKIDIHDYRQIRAGQVELKKAVFNPVSKERQELILKKMLDLTLITEAQYYEALESPIELALGKRSVKGLSSYFVDAVKDEVLQILSEQGHSPEEANHLLYNGGLQIHTSLNLSMQQHLESVVSDGQYFRGDHLDDNGIPQPQVGAVLMDQHTGEVKAILGGRGISGSNLLNRAKNPRQPGSSIKPVSVYLTAMNNGITAGDAYHDAPLQKSARTPYAPKNVAGYQGWTTVRNLLIKSSNVGAVLVARDIVKNDDAASVAKMADTLREIGVTSLITPEQNVQFNDYNFAALSLGGMTYGISPLEMAGAFTTLSNQGMYMHPTFVNKITSATGEELYAAPRQGKQVTSPQNAYILTSMLQDVVRRGTGTYANLPNMHEAGKTGTTNSKRDSWFVGYTPYYTCSVWIGNDDNTPLLDHSRMAARLWRALMRPIHEDLEDKDFEKPDGIYRKYISGAGYTEYFVDGTSPKNTKKLYRPIVRKPKDDDEDNDSKNKKKKSSDNNNNDKKTTKKKRRSSDNNND